MPRIESAHSRLERNFGLDLVRAVAILLVLTCHGMGYVGGVLGRIGVPVETVWWLTGVFGVEIFFALSGWLIGALLLDIQARGMRWQAVRVFMVRRWLRTLPLYFTALFAFTLFPILDPAPQVAWLSYATLTQNLASYVPSTWFAPSWSLTIEEWSYVALPLLALALTRTRNPTVLSAGILILVACVARSISPNDWPTFVRTTVVCRIDAIAYGVLAVAAVRSVGDRLWMPCAVIGSILVGLTLWLLADFRDLNHAVHRLAALPMLSVGLAMMLPAATRIPEVRLIGPVVRWAAALSYSAYLTHWGAMHVADTMPVYWNLATYVVGTISSAALLSWLIEQPIMRRRPSEARVASLSGLAPGRIG